MLLLLLLTQSIPSTPHTPPRSKTRMQGFFFITKETRWSTYLAILDNSHSKPDHASLQLRRGYCKTTLSITSAAGFSWGDPIQLILVIVAQSQLILISMLCSFSSVHTLTSACRAHSSFSSQELTDSVKQSVSAVKTVKQSIFSLVTSIPKV